MPAFSPLSLCCQAVAMFLWITSMSTKSNCMAQSMFMSTMFSDGSRSRTRIDGSLGSSSMVTFSSILRSVLRSAARLHHSAALNCCLLIESEQCCPSHSPAMNTAQSTQQPRLLISISSPCMVQRLQNTADRRRRRWEQRNAGLANSSSIRHGAIGEVCSDCPSSTQ